MITIHYTLSPAGQRAAILAGQFGAAEQSIAVEPTAELLDLASIASDGTATIDARARHGAWRISLLGADPKEPWMTPALDAPLAPDAAAAWVLAEYTRQRDAHAEYRAAEAIGDGLRILAEEVERAELDARPEEILRAEIAADYARHGYHDTRRGPRRAALVAEHDAAIAIARGIRAMAIDRQEADDRREIQAMLDARYPGDIADRYRACALPDVELGRCMRDTYAPVLKSLAQHRDPLADTYTRHDVDATARTAAEWRVERTIAAAWPDAEVTLREATAYHACEGADCDRCADGDEPDSDRNHRGDTVRYVRAVRHVHGRRVVRSFAID